MSPRLGSPFLCCAIERNQRKALNASGGLGPTGEAVHRSYADEPVLRDAKAEGAIRRPEYGSDLALRPERAELR